MELPFTWRASLGTKTIWAVVLAVTLAQFAITYFPPLQLVFETRPIPFWYGVLILMIGVVLFTITETDKQMRLAFSRMKEARLSDR